MKQAYDYIMFAAFIPLLGLLLSAAFRSYLITGLVALVGLLGAGSGLVFGFAGLLKEAEEVKWNFVGLASVYGITLMFCILRRNAVARSREEQIQSIRNRLKNPRDVLISYAGCPAPGTCWHCGAPNAPLRHFRLVRVIVLPIAVGGESLTPPIPLCQEHSNSMHLLPHWARMLAGPFAFLIFLSPLLILGDNFEQHSKVLRIVLVWGALALAMGYYIGSFVWANHVQHFRLRFMDPHSQSAIVRFNDPELARKVQAEIDVQPSPAIHLNSPPAANK